MAVRECQRPAGPCDYLLVVDRKAAGVIEAKPEGMTLTGVAEQPERYMQKLPEQLARYADTPTRRQKVATLQDALAAEDGYEARAAIRALVEAIVLVPEDGRLAIEVPGRPRGDPGPGPERQHPARGPGT